ncbi:A/G-specific adenine glycosylase [Oscillibacter sp. MSJ-2]|uniref:Adenine DNA glycosylase n=1 Tax=Dysosmobacter acutus TaxID=2841504 RepID=A0ABS6F9A8_9FIRM|nr:A/G-specific adenine glycosylase [Dysosmobacter acutus]MBU5625945.1 A/G-specific adenine glycosylase [Dysosmobacter acutus]
MNQERLRQLTVPLLGWYERNARELPWRETPANAYHVWISEIMLQQTRVAAVREYYARFLREFPTIEALAQGEEERLMKCWEGLGYYSRARNLQKAARQTMERFGGELPRTYEELTGLPGIGDYTAGAILSIAQGQRVPAVDGNVLRLAARIMDCDEDIADVKVRRRFRAWVEEALPPAERCGDYNQAMMDLGATVCLPNAEPMCLLCPGRDLCAGREAGRQSSLPVKAPKKKRRVEERTVFVLLSGRGAALRRRPETGLLAGLWEFPNVEGALGEEEAARVLERWGVETLRWEKRIAAKHIFTHVEWHMTGYVLLCRPSGPADFCWAEGRDFADKTVPTAFARFRDEALEHLERQGRIK